MNRARWITIGRSRCTPRRFITTVIIPLFNARALIVTGGPRVHAIDVRISNAPPIRRTASGHVTCIKNNSVELSPTRRKLSEGIGFIICDIFRGLIIPSDKRKAIYIITYINNTPRRRRMGPRGAATWPCVPRCIHVGPARKYPPFCLI